MGANKRIYRLVHDTARRLASAQCMNAPDGFIVEIKPPTRSLEQNEKLHAMIADIAAGCTFMGRKWDKEEWKRLLIDAFVRVMREEAKVSGSPDPFVGQGEVVPALDGHGFVQLGVQSRSFKKAIASEFIEYLSAYGNDHAVRWTDSAQWDEVAA